MDTHLPTILCVDDEPQVLAGLAVNLRRRYHMLSATSGADGLVALSEHPDTAVVVSDMRMPGMDGAAFLKQAREMAPNTVRILLTGQADMDSAISAVNEGRIFRFLTKPCPTVALIAAIQGAVEQHRLITAERVLLEQTLKGIIKTLTDVLALTSPAAFGRASRIKDHALGVAEALALPERWQLEVSAMLSQLGYLALPPELLDKVYNGQPLSEEETEAVARVPAVTEQLLGSIPRLEVVRGILSGYTLPYRAVTDGTDADAALMHRSAHILRLAIDFDTFEAQTGSKQFALNHMVGLAANYDPDAFSALRALQGNDDGKRLREVHLADLVPGMVFAEDVKMDTGTLIVARGFEVTAGVVERMRSIRSGTLKDLVLVIVPSTTPEPAATPPVVVGASV